MTDAEIERREAFQGLQRFVAHLPYRRDFVCPVCRRAYRLDRAVRRAAPRLCQRCKGRGVA